MSQDPTQPQQADQESKKRKLSPSPGGNVDDNVKSKSKSTDDDDKSDNVKRNDSNRKVDDDKSDDDTTKKKAKKSKYVCWRIIGDKDEITSHVWIDADLNRYLILNLRHFFSVLDLTMVIDKIKASESSVLLLADYHQEGKYEHCLIKGEIELNIQELYDLNAINTLTDENEGNKRMYRELWNEIKERWNGYPKSIRDVADLSYLVNST